MVLSDAGRTIDLAIEAASTYRRAMADHVITPAEHAAIEGALADVTDAAQDTETDLRIGLAFFRNGKVPAGLLRSHGEFIARKLQAGHDEAASGELAAVNAR
ncbi:hypothetical protein [Nitrolancea hollandica]|uniref:Uncharacterized protein n=1 Tax=Nitrolancea hollandica Lb TaxID=1129897 RepID=I4EFZ7_9BACT|nr:hypothetical protein [Nitrolancea hollandica]CCF83609.1 hypothetical protein NITHO_2510007 [Nitrolancea hollandica Lb]